MASQQTASDTKKKVSSSPARRENHKAYQTVLPCGNKFLQRKWDQTYYNEHRRLVHSAKPLVDTTAPKVRPHITSKLKKQQLAKERADEIDKDNLTLLKKMRIIMKTEGQVDDKSTYKHHSLNEKQRLLDMERISRENKAMLKRLEEVEPTYKVAEWIEEWRLREELVGRITAFPEQTCTRAHTSMGQSKGKASPKRQDTQEEKMTVTEEKAAEADDPKDPVESTDS